MKLLFDENLSFRLVGMLADLYPQCAHVRDLGLRGADDERVWTYARQHQFIIASKDVDFYQRSILRGAPPKVIWFQIGNAATSTIARLIRAEHSVIRRFAEDPEASFSVLRGTRVPPPDAT